MYGIISVDQRTIERPLSWPVPYTEVTAPVIVSIFETEITL